MMDPDTQPTPHTTPISINLRNLGPRTMIPKDAQCVHRKSAVLSAWLIVGTLINILSPRWVIMYIRIYTTKVFDLIERLIVCQSC